MAILCLLLKLIFTRPVTVDSIQIFAGQRYSAVLHCTQAVGSYWIRADPDLGSTGFDGGINFAILRYAGAPDADPTTVQSSSVLPLNDTNIIPLSNPGAPGKHRTQAADVNINLDLAFNATSLKFKYR